MDYKILMLTLPNPIPTKLDSPGKYEPWSKYGSIDITGGKLTTIDIHDTDANFENVTLRGGAETEQKLVYATTFGVGSASVTYPAGTQLSYGFSTIIKDSVGNTFYASFPRVGTGSAPPEVGGKYSVLLFPQQSKDSTGALLYDKKGQPAFPEFDLARTYVSIDRVAYSSAAPGISYSYPSTAVCFSAGTLIQTLSGIRKIETLSAGDMVATRDNGAQSLAWIGCSRLSGHDLDLAPNLRPIRIAAGALGEGWPAKDLTVSPQHRILVSSKIAYRLHGVAEVLVAAKHLVGLPGITVETPADGVDYWHMLFGRHELVQSNGAWTESLYTGAQAMKGISVAARREIISLFPDLATDTRKLVSVRPMLSGREGRELVRRHERNSKALVNMV